MKNFYRRSALREHTAADMVLSKEAFVRAKYCGIHYCFTHGVMPANLFVNNNIAADRTVCYNKF